MLVKELHDMIDRWQNFARKATQVPHASAAAAPSTSLPIKHHDVLWGACVTTTASLHHSCKLEIAQGGILADQLIDYSPALWLVLQHTTKVPAMLCHSCLGRSTKTRNKGTSHAAAAIDMSEEAA